MDIRYLYTFHLCMKSHEINGARLRYYRSASNWGLSIYGTVPGYKNIKVLYNDMV